MTLDPQLEAQLKQTINVKTIASRGNDGSVTWSAATAVLCRVVINYERLENGLGEEGASTHKIVTKVALNKGDYVWLPGDSAATAKLGRQIREVAIGVDEFGNTDHYEAFL